MDKSKRNILIIVGLILITIAIIALILSNFIPNKENIDNNPSPENPTDSNPDTTFNTKISRLNEINEIFKVQEAINNFYEFAVYEDSKSLNESLETEYKKENNLNESNVLKKFNVGYNSPSYTVKEIYYNANSNLTYYFVNGYFDDIPYDEEKSITFLNDIKYLVIMDSSNHYVIRPLETNSEIEKYANNYPLKEITIANNLTVKKYNVTELDKLTIYLSKYFNTLLYESPSTAYDMLYHTVKETYSTLDEFKANLNNIYNDKSTKIFKYGKKIYNDYTEYSIIDNNQNKITIYEYHIFDYKIEF